MLPAATASPEPLFERYRPRSFAEVVGQSRALAVLERLRSRGGLSGRAYWLAGPSGTGKTTLARLIADEVADEFCVEEVDATDLSGARIRRIERRSHVFGLDLRTGRGTGPELGTGTGGKHGRAYIVNESHGLRKDAIRQLLTTLERIPRHVVWLFTTTGDGAEGLLDEQIDAGPLVSRCVDLPMSRRGLAETLAERARQIARAEGLGDRPKSEYVRLLHVCRLNMRLALQKIEAGAMLTD